MTTTTEAAPSAAPGPLVVFGYRDFRNYAAAAALITSAVQMQSPAVGWQVYEVHHRKVDLGWVGLAQFLPAFGLSLVTGHVADRFDRRRVLAMCIGGFVVASAMFAALARHVGGSLFGVYAVLVFFGVARAFSGPVTTALLPMLVPREYLARAIAWRSSQWQVCVIVGPPIGGLIYAVAGGPTAVYVASGLLQLCAIALVWSLRAQGEPRPRASASVATLFEGVRYVLEHSVILGSISLDLFAVLLGGATALLPAVASDVLHVGTLGLGALRAAPAVGAAFVAIVLAVRPLNRKAGPRMLWAVVVFGVATIVFGTSRSFVLSLVALAVLGAADMVSVVVRQALVQLATPDAMRGRVGAVNQVFVGASNELGEFESGLTAEWWGTVPAIVAGGIGTLLVVALWAWRFPALREVDQLDGAVAKD